MSELAESLNELFNSYLCAGPLEKLDKHHDLLDALWENKAGIIAELRAPQSPANAPSSRPYPAEQIDLMSTADAFEDIEVNPDGFCRWTEVANALDRMRSEIRAVPSRSAAMNGEPVADMADVHPTLVVDVQAHRDAAYKNGWDDGYAEGFGKATADAAPTPSPDAGAVRSLIALIIAEKIEVTVSHDSFVINNGELADLIFAALASSAPVERWQKEVAEIVSLYFAPWGAAKGARWEALTGDQPFNAEVAMSLIEAAITRNDRVTP